MERIFKNASAPWPGVAVSALPDDDIRGLLLHTLTADAAEALEERLMLDDTLLDAVLDTEHELLDRYATGSLDAATRTAVERYLLATPLDRQRLLFARALSERARQTAQPPPQKDRPSIRARAARWAGGALLAATLAGFVLLFVRERMPSNTSSLEAIQTPLPAAPSKGFDYTIVLLASVERGTEIHVSKIPATAQRVRLQLEVEKPDLNGRYRVSLAEGDAPAHVIGDNLPLLRAGSRTYVETEVAVSALVPGSRRITVDVQTPGSRPFSFSWDLRPSIEE